MGVIFWGLLNAVGLFALSRRRRRPRFDGPDLRFVFVVPALNEGRVIGATVRHLLGFPGHAVIVVDDASEDDTAAEILAIDDPRVVLLRRQLPDARLGKGEALNAAFQWLRSSPLGDSPDRVIVCVADADGRLHASALHEAAVCFAAPQVGAAQVSVRIRNRNTNYWTRMQHFEFVAFTALYQGGRQHTGAVGLGGNGQFVRLSALQSLGTAPWSSCLTEDMDLGIRLLLAGWTNRYISTSWVSQQAVPDFPRLLRQRTRWFQGALQCLGHLRSVAGSDRLPLKTRVDLVGLLLAPLFLLVASPLVFAGWLRLAIRNSGAVPVGGGPGRILAVYAAFYTLAFLPALLLSFVFWLDEQESTIFSALIAGHLFVFYGYLWPFVGWRALGRQLARRCEWTKTARVAEAPVALT